MNNREKLKAAIIDLLDHVPERAIRFVYSFLLEWTKSSAA